MKSCIVKACVTTACTFFAANVSAANWSRSGGTLTDGDSGWVITVSGNDDNLTLSGINSSNASNPELLDLCALDGTSGYTLVRTGTSRMIENNTTIKKIILPDTVTEIGRNGFRGNSALTNIVMNGVTNIAGAAFYGAKSLTCKLVLPNLLSVGNQSFEGATGITGLVSPRLETVGDSAFRDCTGIKGELILTNLTSIGRHAFFKTGVQKVNISNDCLKVLSPYVFHSCSAMTELIVASDKLEIIGEHSLQANGLTGSWSFPNVTNVEVCAFYGTKITGINLPRAQTIGNQAFYGSDLTGDLVLPEVLTIGSSAFYNNRKITNAVLPKVTSLGDEAFRTCNAITNMYIPNVERLGVRSLQEIAHRGELVLPKLTTLVRAASDSSNYYTFYGIKAMTGVDFPLLTNGVIKGGMQNCTGLVRAKLPNLKIFASEFFYGCTALKEFKFAYCAITNGIDVFKNSGVTNIYVHEKSPLAIQSASNNDGDALIKSGRAAATVIRYGGSETDENGVEWFYDDCPYDEDNAAHALSATTATLVGAPAVNGEKVMLPKKLGEKEVTAVGDGAFWYNKELTGVKLPLSVKAVGKKAFPDDCMIFVPMGMSTSLVDQLKQEYGEDNVKGYSAGFIIIVR